MGSDPTTSKPDTGQLKRFFRAGLTLLASAPTILLPVLVFLLFDHFVSNGAVRISATENLTTQFFQLLSNPWVFATLGISFVIKSLSILFSNADMYLALKQQRHRHAHIFKVFGPWQWLLLVGICLLWNAAFVIAALAVLAVGEPSIGRTPALVLTGVIGIALFPIYYAGMSLGSLAVMLTRLEHAPISELWARVWRNRRRVYLYYALRSAIDATVIFIVPIAWAKTVDSALVGLIGTLITIAIFVTYIRATFIVFKRDLLVGEFGLGSAVRTTQPRESA